MVVRAVGTWCAGRLPLLLGFTASCPMQQILQECPVVWTCVFLYSNGHSEVNEAWTRSWLLFAKEELTPLSL